ncbi:uncharacterized protein LOC132747909 [Ruditapes philippinarum]|uniref:uncharacterized protein LOC132747909 n=1 Tax=Ruditapes philippinarum TaxID=129788 RepID=UPI00295BDF9B|nr:uncharacterized protein LOC132747909 [Ruditapes philippinarum]
MKDKLFNICSTIKRIGYRFRTFYIYAVQPIGLEDKEIRNNKIREILKMYGIFHYVIAPCSEKIQELMHTGAEIEARSETYISLRSRQVSRPIFTKGGTLGGFVKTDETNQEFCLLSKHVAQYCSDVFYVGDENNESTCIGQILTETNIHQHGSLDISASLMNKPVGEESTKFNDKSGRPLKGRLHEYNEDEEDDICRSGQSVHIYGAVSKPGEGVITMPIAHSGLTSPLIQIEDIGRNHGQNHGQFATKGDSGAVVCVDDPERRHVVALGMVMGVDQNSSGRKYLALPLSKGIQQIEAQTRTRLELM